jgi:phosphoglycerate dehydrogenase-like enzyme
MEKANEFCALESNNFVITKPKATVLLDKEHWGNIYGSPDVREAMADLVEIQGPFHTAESIHNAGPELAQAEVLMAGWGMVKCDANFLSQAPRLKAIFYAGGSVRGIVTDALWNRGIRLSSTNQELGAGVAEFALGQILLSMKSVWRHQLAVRRARTYERVYFPGIYGSTVGLISVGTIARHLVKLLQPFHLNLIAYDPFLSGEQARVLGITLCSLDEVMAKSDVISLHTPLLPETQGMMRGRHFELMRPGTTFINTARGGVINQAEFIDVFSRRTDLFALLDVTWPEPPPCDSPIYDLPNVLITPHIAGALGRECRRLGQMAVDECRRFLHGEPLIGEVTREMMDRIA